MSRRRTWLIVILFVSAMALGSVFWLDPLGRSAFSRIEDGLYLGEHVATPPRGTQAIVNVCAQANPYETEHSFWEPLDGGRPPNIELLERVSDFIAAQRAAGRTTYVHCWAGQNRSAAIVAAYLMREHGWTRERALSFVRSKRPSAEPNNAYLELLARWEIHLRGP